MSRFETLFSPSSTFSRFNIDQNMSDIEIFVTDYKRRILLQINEDELNAPSQFVSFNEAKLLKTGHTQSWLPDNEERFFKDTPNLRLAKEYYLSAMGFITTAAYSFCGEFIIVGHSTGLIQMRHGHTGTVLATLRNIQFPPKAVYAIEISHLEERICYAACTDGAVYRVEIPAIDTGGANPPEYCIRADPNLEWLNTIFYSSSAQNLGATPFVSQRSPALAVTLTADGTKLLVGYADTSVKVYDVKTQEVLENFKVHKLRLQFIPKKLQRLHTGQVVALRCHNENPNLFASAAWDKTFRIWDTRCKVGCMMTFQDVDIVSDAIDLNRNEAVTGSWTATEAVSHWDLTARKRISIVRVQNRRPDVDGEYVYACRYWRSMQYNRKGKYAIIGGSGTGCVEVINLHNRYITCSYPAPGTVLAITSYQDRIAFGGTAPVFNIVSFHDPKHEKYKSEGDEIYDYSEHAVTLFENHLRDFKLAPSEFEASESEAEPDVKAEKAPPEPKARTKPEPEAEPKAEPEGETKPTEPQLTDISRVPLKKKRTPTVFKLQKPPKRETKL